MRQKRLLSIVMAVVLSLCSLPIKVVWAQQNFSEKETLQKREMEDFEKSVQEITPQSGNVRTANNVWEGYRYEELEDGTLEITGYTWDDTELVIPAEIDGKRVTRIGEQAFDYYRSLTSIKLPAGLTSIGGYAFADCSSLSNIELPSSLTSIGSDAFRSCISLENIELPSSLASIGSDAFEYCSSLTSIELPSGLTSIGDGAFCGCISLTKIIVNKDNPNYISQDGILYNKDQKELICCPGGKKGKIVIPESVVSIQDRAFEDCIGLTNIKLPADLTSIGCSAFENCSSLTNIKLPAGLTSIGYSAFENCSSLTNIKLPAGLSEVQRWTFKNCSNLTNIELPESLTDIEHSAFSGCSSLTNIKLPASLVNIQLPTSITIKTGASEVFSGCSSLTEIIVDKNNPNYMSQDGILYNKNQKELICCPGGRTGKIVIPASVSNIKHGAFRDCSKLINIKLPADLTKIENSSFKGCSSLTNIELPAGLTSIEDSSFSGCSSLTNIELPASLTSIGHNAFENCSKLTNIKLTAGLTSIEDSAFINCSSLTEIMVDRNNLNYMSQDGILYDKNQTKLICCPGGKKGKIVISASVNNFGYNVFDGCGSLTEIMVDGNNENYMSQDGMLYDKNQTKLKCCPGGKTGSIVIPASIVYILYDAFNSCGSLTEIIVDKNNPVYMSQDGILYDKNQKQLICCPGGKTGSIVIPASVTSISEYSAFKGCSSLTEIMVDENNPVYMSQNGILYNKNQKKLIRCPEGKTGKIVIPKSIIDIDEYAFDNCKDLVLLVCKGSYAEAYAKNYNLNYRYIDDIDNCSHTWDTNIVQATTKKNGSVTKTCTKCGKKTIETVYAVKNINLSKTSYTYNGKIHKPSVIVKNSKGKALKNKKDYTTTYSKNIKNVGSYIITIKLKGNYKDTVKKTFQIVPKGTKISKITPKKKGFVLKWNKQSVQTTGYEIAYSTNKKFTKKTTGTITIGKNKTVSKSVSKLKVRKKYFVKIRTYKTIKRNRKSKKLYSTWSKVKVVTTKK